MINVKMAMLGSVTQPMSRPNPTLTSDIRAPIVDICNSFRRPVRWYQILNQRIYETMNGSLPR